MLDAGITDWDKLSHSTDTVGCNYLSLPLNPASGIQVLIISTSQELSTHLVMFWCQ